MWSFILFILLTTLVYVISNNKNTPNSYDEILYNGVSNLDSNEKSKDEAEEMDNDVHHSVESSSDNFTQDDIKNDADGLLNDILGG